MKVVYYCWVFSLTILFSEVEVGARYRKENTRRDESSDEVKDYPNSPAVARNRPKTSSIRHKSYKFSLKQDHKSASASGDNEFEAGKLELDMVSSGKQPLRGADQSKEGKLNQPRASNVKQLYHFRNAHDRSLKADVYKKHSITRAKQISTAKHSSVDAANSVKALPFIKEDSSNSYKSGAYKKQSKRINSRSKMYKKYNLALLGAVPAQTVGYLPLGGVLQSANYLPADSQVGLNSLLGTSTSDGILPQLPLTSQFSSTGIIGGSVLPSDSVDGTQGVQSQSQPSVASFAAKSEGSEEEQTKNLQSEQLQDQLGTSEQQTDQSIVSQNGGQNIQGQQIVYQQQSEPQQSEPQQSEPQQSEAQQSEPQQSEPQQEPETESSRGVEGTGSLSDVFGSNAQQNEGRLSFSFDTSQITGAREGASRVTSDEEHAGGGSLESNVINVGSDGTVDRNASPEGTQNQDQTSILDENQSNVATTAIEAAEPGAETTESSPETGKETQGVPEGGNDASFLAENEPESENNNYVAYAANQQTDSENSLGSLDQDPGNLQQQDDGLTAHAHGNGSIANENLLHSSSSSLLPTNEVSSTSKDCKGCPPRARCIRSVCVINEDEPLAHILSALSGSEENNETAESKVDSCSRCHQFAQCVNKRRRACICRPGYVGDGMNCEPDACLPGCHKHGKCINGFCVCDGHHYFNGQECAPYQIRRLHPCQPTCLSNCTAACPKKCCRQSDHLGKVLKPSNMTSKVPKESGTEMFSVGLAPAKPITLCPEHCLGKCNKNCPKHCCNAFCPKICASKCLGDCPAHCCKLNITGLQKTNSSLTKSSKKQLVKAFLQKFCSPKCNNNCDISCPPVCCYGNSLFFPAENGKHVKKESAKSMNWSEMMKFLENLFHAYGALNKSKAMFENLKKEPLENKNDASLFKTSNKTLPFKQLKTVMMNDDSPAAHSKPKEAQTQRVIVKANETKPDHKIALIPTVAQPGVVIKQENSSSLNSNQKPKVPTDEPTYSNPLCPSHCKNHCYRECHYSCCFPGGPIPSQSKAPSQEDNFMNGYDIAVSPISTSGSMTRNPYSRPAVSFVSPSFSNSQASPPKDSRILPYLPLQTQRQWGALNSCPANCPQECFPGCTYRCCIVGNSYQRSGVNLSSGPRSTAVGSLQQTACPNGCSKACYPHCNQKCCQSDIKSDTSHHYATKIPCPRVCRPFSCFAYCHHDCCLRPNRKRTKLQFRPKIKVTT